MRRPRGRRRRPHPAVGRQEVELGLRLDRAQPSDAARDVRGGFRPVRQGEEHTAARLRAPVLKGPVSGPGILA